MIGRAEHTTLAAGVDDRLRSAGLRGFAELDDWQVRSVLVTADGELGARTTSRAVREGMPSTGLDPLPLGWACGEVLVRRRAAEGLMRSVLVVAGHVGSDVEYARQVVARRVLPTSYHF